MSVSGRTVINTVLGNSNNLIINHHLTSIKEGSERYGLWKDGKRVKWFNSEKESFNYLGQNQKRYLELFRHDLSDITAFLKS